MSDEYRVQLDVFSGPLDLLLYLIRRDELDIQDIALTQVADQYLEYAKVLEVLDPNAAGDFLVLAATLIEIKSRALLPAPPLEAADDDDDPRATLVRELLEYKRFKDAAKTLGTAADERAKRYVRKPADLPKDADAVELEDVQLWDLVGAFSRVMTAIGRGPGRHEVLYDDTPIETYAAELLEILASAGPTTFQDVFRAGRNRAAAVGLFLALLELMRSRRLQVTQDKNFGTIYLVRLEEVDDAGAPSLDPPPARSSEAQQAATDEPASEPTDEQRSAAPEAAEPDTNAGTGTPDDQTE